MGGGPRARRPFSCSRLLGSRPGTGSRLLPLSPSGRSRLPRLRTDPRRGGFRAWRFRGVRALASALRPARRGSRSRLARLGSGARHSPASRAPSRRWHRPAAAGRLARALRQWNPPGVSSVEPVKTSPLPRASRRRLRLAGLGVALLLVLDWSRAPSQQVSAGVELAAIQRYQKWISPWLHKGGVRCRFAPSCSQYAAAVVARDGFVAGNFRALRRLVRCGPWTAAGTADPP